MAKKAGKKRKAKVKAPKKPEARHRPKRESFCKRIVRNRFFSYAAILLGGIILDGGILIINSAWKKTSAIMIIIGAVMVIYALQLIVKDDFRI